MTRSGSDNEGLQALRAAIDRTGYYPEIVGDGIALAVGGESVGAFYVHHEPTIDRDEVRRHITVLVLTPSRLILAHTDEHPPDELMADPYTSTSTEAVSLSSVKSVVVSRLVGNPQSGAQPPAEVVVTIGWGGLRRIDIEPATCADPDCTADHGYAGVLASDDFSLRVSAAAEGQDAVERLLGFAEVLSSSTQAG